MEFTLARGQEDGAGADAAASAPEPAPEACAGAEAAASAAEPAQRESSSEISTATEQEASAQSAPPEEISILLFPASKLQSMFVNFWNRSKGQMTKMLLRAGGLSLQNIFVNYRNRGFSSRASAARLRPLLVGRQN